MPSFRNCRYSIYGDERGDIEFIWCVQTFDVLCFFKGKNTQQGILINFWNNFLCWLLSMKVLIHPGHLGVEQVELRQLGLFLWSRRKFTSHPWGFFSSDNGQRGYFALFQNNNNKKKTSLLHQIKKNWNQGVCHFWFHKQVSSWMIRQVKTR